MGMGKVVREGGGVMRGLALFRGLIYGSIQAVHRRIYPLSDIHRTFERCAITALL